MERRNKVLFILIILLAVFLFVSQNFGAQGAYVLDLFDWTSYEVTPGSWRYVSFQDSVMGVLLPVLGYFPSIVAGLALAGAFVLIASTKASKICCMIAGIVAIFGLIIYLMPTIFLGMFGSDLPFPNELGAYLYMVSGIGVLILAFLIKGPAEVGYVKEDKDYYAIGDRPAPSPAAAQPVPKGPRVQCPNCGALVAGEQLFCEQCGEYF